MSRQVLFLGSSHTATLYLARDQLKHVPNTRFDWFVTPANCRFPVDPRTSKISLPKEYLEHEHSAAHRTVGGRDGAFYLRDYDEVIFSAVGARPLRPLGKTHPAFALSTSIVSDPLLAAMLAHAPGIVEAEQTLADIRAADFSGVITCEPWVRPSSLPRGITPDGWQRFCEAEAEFTQEIIAKHDARIVPHLTQAGNLSRPEFLRDPTEKGPHGSQLYADRMMASLIAHLV